MLKVKKRTKPATKVQNPHKQQFMRINDEINYYVKEENKFTSMSRKPNGRQWTLVSKPPPQRHNSPSIVIPVVFCFFNQACISSTAKFNTWRTISYNMAAAHANCATFWSWFTNAVKNFTKSSMEVSIARNRGHFAPAFIGQRSMLYCSGIKTKWRRGLRRLIKGETSSIQNTEWFKFCKSSLWRKKAKEKELWTNFLVFLRQSDL